MADFAFRDDDKSTMSPADLRAELARRKIAQGELARLLEINPATLSKRLNGDVRYPLTKSFVDQLTALLFSGKPLPTRGPGGRKGKAHLSVVPKAEDKREDVEGTK